MYAPELYRLGPEYERQTALFGQCNSQFAVRHRLHDCRYKRDIELNPWGLTFFEFDKGCFERNLVGCVLFGCESRDDKVFVEGPGDLVENVSHNKCNQKFCKITENIPFMKLITKNKGKEEGYNPGPDGVKGHETGYCQVCAGQLVLLFDGQEEAVGNQQQVGED